jgi:coenzyme F420-dependent glucose-6-phosphate dehydrogenase
MKEWPNGGMSFPKGDIRSPEDFEAMAKLVRPENFKNRVLMTPDLDQHVKQLQGYIDLGFNEIYIHNVARTQEAFIDAYGKHVIPALKWPS